MTFANYIPLALRTESRVAWMKRLSFIPAIRDMERKRRLLHAAIGLCTESVELSISGSIENYTEELGDICWYLAIAYNVLDISDRNANMAASLAEDQASHYNLIIFDAAECLDAMKKVVFYHKRLPAVYLQIGLHLDAILGAVVINCAKRNLTFGDILERNIAKLRVRYPAKFTSESALVRDLAAEAKVLK